MTEHEHDGHVDPESPEQAASALDLGPQEPQEPQGAPGAAPHGAAGGARSTPTRKMFRTGLEWVLIIALAVAAAFGFKTYVAQTFTVPTGSMIPTIMPGDRIVVSKLSFHLHAVERGNIIVFVPPTAEASECRPDPYLVKRVIGLPGEWISSKGDHVLINGKVLHEPWTLNLSQGFGPPIPLFHVPANEYYVLGDNRYPSCDSRYWGPVKRSEVVGDVIGIIWPLGRIRVL